MNQINQYYEKIKNNFRHSNQKQVQTKQPQNLQQKNYIFQGDNVLSNQLLDMKRKIREIAHKNPFAFIEKYGYHNLMASKDQYERLIGNFPKKVNFATSQPQSQKSYYKGKQYEQRRNRQEKNLNYYLQYHEHIPDFSQNNNQSINNQYTTQQYNHQYPANLKSNRISTNYNNFNSQYQGEPVYPVPKIIANQNYFHLDLEDNFSDITQFPNPLIRYKIMPTSKLKMTLDVTTIDQDDKYVKGNVIIYDYHGGPNQSFYFKRINNNNQYYIISASTGFALEVPNGSINNGVQMTMSPRFGFQNQIWTLVQTKSKAKNEYKILSFCGKALDISNQWMINGNAVIQYDNKKQQDSKNQRWIITPC